MILNLYKMCAGKSRGLYFIAFAINKIYWEKLGEKKQTEEKCNFKTLSLILQTFDNMTLNSPLTEVRPDVLAAMWVRASLPVPGWKSPTVKYKLSDPSEGTTCLQRANLERRTARQPSTLTVSMLAMFLIKTRAEGKQLNRHSQRFWPEIWGEPSGFAELRSEVSWGHTCVSW